MDIRKIIGLRIAALRRQKGLTQSQLSELIDLTPQAVSKLERGTHQPKPTTLALLGRALDVPLSTLLEDPPTDPGAVEREAQLRELSAAARQLSTAHLSAVLGLIEALLRAEDERETSTTGKVRHRDRPRRTQ